MDKEVETPQEPQAKKQKKDRGAEHACGDGTTKALVEMFAAMETGGRRRRRAAGR
jgi:hypothetical protein